MSIEGIVDEDHAIEERTVRYQIFYGTNKEEEKEIEKNLKEYDILEEMKYLLSLEDKHNLSLIKNHDTYLVCVNNSKTFSKDTFLKIQDKKWKIGNKEHIKFKDYFDYLEIAKKYINFLGF